MNAMKKYKEKLGRRLGLMEWEDGQGRCKLNRWGHGEGGEVLTSEQQAHEETPELPVEMFMRK